MKRKSPVARAVPRESVAEVADFRNGGSLATSATGASKTQPRAPRFLYSVCYGVLVCSTFLQEFAMTKFHERLVERALLATTILAGVLLFCSAAGGAGETPGCLNNTCCSNQLLL